MQATSFDAYREIQPHVATMKQTVLMFLRSRGPVGATDEEIQEGLQMNPSTQRPRRIELFDEKLIGTTGEQRLTRSGRNALVWVAV